MDADYVKTISEAVAEKLAATQPLGIWDYLNINRWIPEIGVLAGAIVFIWRCSVFFVKANNTHRELKKYTKAYEKEKENNANLRQELDRIKEVQVIDGMLFVTHDPYPQNPICPSCYADGKIIRMAGYGSLNASNEPEVGYCCIKCKCVIVGTNAENFATNIKKARKSLTNDSSSR